MFYPEPQQFLAAQSSATFSYYDDGNVYYSDPIVSRDGKLVLVK